MGTTGHGDTVMGTAGHREPMGTPRHGRGAPSCPAPCGGAPMGAGRSPGPLLAQGPARGQPGHSRAAQGGGNGRGQWGCTGSGLQTAVCAQDFPWQPPARSRAAWGVRDGAKLAPRRPRRMSFTAISIPELPAFLWPGGGGGASAAARAFGTAGREFWHAAVPSRDSGFFQPGSEGH